MAPSTLSLAAAIAFSVTACSSTNEEQATDIVDSYVESLQSQDQSIYEKAVGSERAANFGTEIDCLDWASVAYVLTPDSEVGSFYTVKFTDESNATIVRSVQHGGVAWRVESAGTC